MTPQEAIEIIKDPNRHYRVKADGAYEYKEFVEALEMAKQALEKQIPKIPLYHCDQDLCYDGMGCVEGEELYKYYECPNCGWREEIEVFENFKLKYCPNCGQALDWSVENDKL